MKFPFLAPALAACFASGAAFAADLPPVAPAPVAPAPAAISFDPFAGGFDYAFGAKVMSDYISRGISQSARHPSGTAYGELRYGWFYAGMQPWSVNLPQDPTAEVDLYGGIRPTFGPVNLDFGYILYTYPGSHTQYFLNGGGILPFYTPGAIATAPRNPQYAEIYAKATYNVTDQITVGSNLYYSPSWTGTGASGTYFSGTAKYAIPNTDFSISAELGRYVFGTSKPLFGPTTYISYTTWNLGVSYVYKAATLDLRYYDTTLNRDACFINTSDPAGNFLAAGPRGVGPSNWCGARFVASLSVDFTSATFKLGDDKK
ncbi:MAG: TorF family putative porin [Beijerinckiaceae bacterium]